MQNRALVERIRKLDKAHNIGYEKLARENFAALVKGTTDTSQAGLERCEPTEKRLFATVEHVRQGELLIANVEKEIDKLNKAFEPVCKFPTQKGVKLLDDMLCDIIDNQHAQLKAHFAERAKEDFDTLPAVDYNNIILSVESSAWATVAYKPKKFDSIELEDCFYTALRIAQKCIDLVSRYEEYYKQLEILLPKQRKAFEDCRQKLFAAQDKIEDLSKPSSVIAPQAYFQPNKNTGIVQAGIAQDQQRLAPVKSCSVK